MKSNDIKHRRKMIGRNTIQFIHGIPGLDNVVLHHMYGVHSWIKLDVIRIIKNMLPWNAITRFICHREASPRMEDATGNLKYQDEIDVEN